MLNKVIINKTQKGFNLQPSQQYIEKEQRKMRIKQAIESRKSTPTNKDIYDLLLDIAKEVYDT